MTAVPATRAVLVTRPGGAGDPLARRLAEAGIRVHAVPTVATRDVAPGGDLDAAVSDLDRYDWVVVTSATGAAALAAALGRVAGGHVPARATAVPRFAAVGPATANALREAGLEVTVQAVDVTGTGLGRALQAVDELAGRRVLLPRASAAAPELPALLRAAGADVREVVAYETVEGPLSSRDALAAALADPLLGAVAVASGSAVRGLVALAATAGPGAAGPAPSVTDPDAGTLAADLRALPFVSIGPSTSDEVRRLGLRLAAQAAAPTVDALADAILDVLERRPRPGDVFSVADHPTEVHR